MDTLQVGDKAPDSIVVDAHGQDIHLNELWQDGSTLLVFLRHFGCIYCRERLNQLARHREEIEQAGLNIVTIGLGESEHAKTYCGSLLPDALCLASEDSSVYKTYGFSHIKLGNILSFTAIQNTVRAVTSGQMQGQTTGDVRMIGGTFIIDQAGVVQYAYYSKTPGDHPSFERILEVGKKILN